MVDERPLVVIAEDTEIQAKKLVFYLERFGYRTHHAWNGKECLEFLEREGRSVELIITDVQMPEMDGLELLSRVKASEKTLRVPVVVMTTLEDEETCIDALERGANEFLKKPFSVPELRAKCKNLVALHQYEKLILQENNNLTEDLVEKNRILEKQHHELLEMQDQLVKAAKAASSSVFSGGVAHEINNPLGIIQGYSQQIDRMIRTGNDDFNKLASLNKKIASGAHRIKRIISQLQRLGGNETIEAKSTVNIRKFIMELEQVFSGHLENSQVLYELQFSDVDDVMVEIDDAALSQVVLALVNNAVDSMLERKNSSLVLSVSRENDQVVIAIQDHGGGVPEEIADRIFDPFFTTKPPGEGVGLGLSLASQYVKSMHGDLSFSNTGTGAMFSFNLPITAMEEK